MNVHQQSLLDGSLRERVGERRPPLVPPDFGPEDLALFQRALRPRRPRHWRRCRGWGIVVAVVEVVHCFASRTRKTEPNARARGGCVMGDGRWPMMSPEAVSGRYACPAVPLAR
eukprot:373735-Prymnesium_polylepis.1